MNNVENTLWLGFIAVIAFTSMYFLFSDIGNSGVTLDQESSQMLDKYGTSFGNYQDENELINVSQNLSGLPNYYGVDAEFRESAEAKGTVSTFGSLWNSLVVTPALMLSMLPFIDQTTGSFIVLIIETFIILIGIMQLIALYKALRGGNTNN